MKWIFHVCIFVCTFYGTVHGHGWKNNNADSNMIYVDPINYEEEGFLKVGATQKMVCKGTNKNQKLEWLDHKSDVFKSNPNGRVFVQEYFVKANKGRAPALTLTINRATLQDAGNYQCRSNKKLVKSVSLCIIEPAQFMNTSSEVTTDIDRSITLSCQAKGDPEPTLKWMRNDEIIDDDFGSKYRIMTKYNIESFEGLLTIMSLEPEDAGVYSCISEQNNELAENCTHYNVFNVTLNVNYAPFFERTNDTQFLYHRNNEKVEIECSTPAYPAPIYRWFREEGDLLVEYDEKHVTIVEDENKAILSITANPSTFGKHFKCEATNEHGFSYQYFILMELEKPMKPDKVQPQNETENSVALLIKWNDLQFPVSVFDVQYKKKDTKTLRPSSWKRSKISEIEPDDYVEPGSDDGILFTVPDLDDETAYWLRVRARNELGDSPWSETIVVQTTEHLEVTTTEAPEETEKETEETKNEENESFDPSIYGMLFGFGVIIVVAASFLLSLRCCK